MRGLRRSWCGVGARAPPKPRLLPPPLGILDRPGISGVLHSAASICMRWHAALSSTALKQLASTCKLRSRDNPDPPDGLTCRCRPHLCSWCSATSSTRRGAT